MVWVGWDGVAATSAMARWLVARVVGGARDEGWALHTPHMKLRSEWSLASDLNFWHLLSYFQSKNAHCGLALWCFQSMMEWGDEGRPLGCICTSPQPWHGAWLCPQLWVPPGQEAWSVVFQSTSSFPNGNAQQYTRLHLHSHELTSSFFNSNIIGLSKLELLCSLETSGHFPSQSWWFVIFFSEISRDVQNLVCMNN